LKSYYLATKDPWN